MKKEFTNLSLRIPHQAEIYLPINPKRVYVLLHGFKQDGSFIFNKLNKIFSQDSAIIAPNGPFLVPVLKHGNYSPKYAWYFFDPNKQAYYINYDPAAEYIKSILIEMNLIRKPVTIIGYSQGGYLAPKLAEIIPSVDTVIGMACAFRTNKFKFRQNVIMNQINSRDDLIIDYMGAKEEFSDLRLKGNVGQFITLADTGHRLDESYINELKLMI